MSSLSIASKIASSSLTAAQVQLSVTSSNIANADTEGYTAKSAAVSSATTSGVGTGVAVTDITSNVSELLIAQLAGATSNAAAAEKTASYLDQLQTALGHTTSGDGGGTSLANLIAEAETALSDLANTPESETLAVTAVDALDSLTSEIRELSSDIQSLRETADKDIGNAVESANQAIEEIASLNDLIVTAQTRGESTADLEDQRNSALVSLSEFMGVTAFTSDDGSMDVYTNSGQLLVGENAYKLDFSTTSNIKAGDTYASGDLSGITVNGIDITGGISTGSISSLLELRDETLPGVQASVDELASGLISDLNVVRPGLLTGADGSDISVDSTVLELPSSLLDSTDPYGQAADLLSAMQGDHLFADAGNLGERTTDFASYATDILSNVVTMTNSASTKLDRAEDELTTISDTITSTYGVNLDEEIARLSELETLYSVSSQVLSVVQEMFDDLIAAVQ
ncbi:flagellar hook-associated protein FlgK [Roseibium sp. RKSG952]|uniref:flagellar hook-associated protein FlgK n=1 Tax=Roseibium sp. RKSG952 TaxID=2529384 RepID=UPI0012BD5082|nr:flagellar hook-associated protein FlgK [Roseibium sp. RKSG952]MTH97453.1 flagellar hook-associated protein FlgK [Roseibium sp. RKSG952]